MTCPKCRTELGACATCDAAQYCEVCKACYGFKGMLKLAAATPTPAKAAA